MVSFFKTVLAVWVALVLANAFEHYQIEKMPPFNDNGDKTFCISIEGFTK